MTVRGWPVAALLAAAACAPPATSLPTPTPGGAATSPSASPTASATRAATPTPRRADLAAIEIARAVDPLVAAFPGRSAVVVADGRDGRVLYEHDADETVLAASFYKLAVLLEAERRIAAGTLTDDVPVRVTVADHREGGAVTPAGTTLALDEALDRMITRSDNATALALIRLLGVAAIHAAVEAEGVGPLRFTRTGAMTSARAIATFFGELARSELVSATASARMLDRLERQEVAGGIPKRLPPGTVVAHKTGALELLTHDAGIVYEPDGVPVVVVVLTWESLQPASLELIGEVAAIAYRSME